METRAIGDDEILIRKLLEQWAYTTKTGRQNEVLNNHAPDVIIYDVLPPLKYESPEAYRKKLE